MIFIQNGTGWKPKVLKIIKENKIDGIIWDPRSEALERVIQIKKENPEIEKLEQIVDPKNYYKQFSDSETKLLENCTYFPKEKLDRNFFRDKEKVNEMVKETFEYQINYNVQKLLLPTLYLDSLNSRMIDCAIDMIDSMSNLHKKYEKYSKFLSLVIQENAFNNKNDVDNFIEEISNYIENINGIYIVIDRDKEDNIRHNFNPNRLTNIMWMNASFKDLGLDLIYGYTDMEILMYAVSGVEKFGVGWFHSLRRFNAEVQGLQMYDSGGRQIKRYTSLKLLYGVKLEDAIINVNLERKKEIIDCIVGDTKKDEKIKTISSVEGVSLNETYSQHFEALRILSDMMISEESYKNRIVKCKEYLNIVLENIKKHNDPKNLVLDKFTNTHVENYLKALKEFEKMILI